VILEPVVGWRQWNFMYPHFLANLGYDTIYVPREKIEARCEQEDQSEQQAPHLTCTCGIYAYKEKPRLLREIRNTYGRPLAPPFSGLRLVYGEIRTHLINPTAAVVRPSRVEPSHAGRREGRRILAQST